MMAGVRLSSFLFLLVIVVLLGMLAQQLLAEEPTTSTTTYKSTTIERVTTTHEETKVVEQPVQKEKPLCAVIVRNRAVAVPDTKVDVLQDFVTGHVTDAGFSLIAPENVASVLNAAAAANGKSGASPDMLANTSSALQLARDMGADAILSLSISSYGVDTTTYTGHNLNVTAINYRLKVSYALLDVLHGGSRTAGVVTVCFTDRRQPELASSRENVLDDLLDGAAADAANMLAAALRNGKTAGLAEARAQQMRDGAGATTLPSH